MGAGKTLVLDVGAGDCADDVRAPLDAAMPGLAALVLGRIAHAGALRFRLLTPELPELTREGLPHDAAAKWRFAVEAEYGDGEAFEERNVKWSELEPNLAKVQAAGITHEKHGDM
eukprot:gene11047-62153_t